MDINDNNGNELDGKSRVSVEQFNGEVGKKRKNVLIIIFIIIIFVLTNIASYIFGINFVFGSGNINSLSNSVGDYRKFFLVRSILNEVYNGEMNDDVMIDAAIKGMVNSLGDPYTVYMNEEEFSEFNASSKGEYVGIGIQVAYRDDHIVVVSVFDDSPAYKAGIHPGDYIVSVRGEKVSDIDSAIDLIKGEEFTNVDIVVQRDGEEKEFSVQREKIVLLPVEYRKIDEKIGYMKINSFDENSSKGVREALKDMNSEGIILDLRGNPGGLLDECINIVSEFIKEGLVIVSTNDKYGNSEVFKAKKGIAEEIKIVVLANSSSASASEVLTGALRDHNRSTFVGETTFGKGLVQSVFNIDEGSGLKVTISKYYTPNGEFINGIGIKPDVEIKYSQEDYVKNRELAQGDVDIMNELDPQYQKALEIIKQKVYGN